MKFILSLINKIGQNKFFKHGVPCFIIVIGGSIWLKEFTELRYKYKSHTILRPEEIEEATGKQMKKRGEVTMESEFEKLSAIDIDNWENIRGPRPWEEETMRRR